MPDQRIDRPSPLDEQGTQHVIVLQVLRDDHPDRWTLTELASEADHIDPAAIATALARLGDQGVVERDDEELWASPCARHIDALGLIAI
jgi:hypothetical protein